MVKDEMSLQEFKQQYEKFREKYSLPEFNEMNKLFDIESIETDETDFLLRKIRRIISDRIAGCLRFVEIILNPSNAPVFLFKIIKKLEEKDKEILDKVNETLGQVEVEIVALDLDYSEEKEAEFIKRIFKVFNEDVRIKLLKITEKLSNNEGAGPKKTDERSYFG